MPTRNAMNVGRINDIVTATTTVYRKGEVVDRREVMTSTGEVVADVIEINAYPATGTTTGPFVDMVFFQVQIDLPEAERRRAEIIDCLGDMVGPESGIDYRAGPSYIHIGGDLGSQEAALRFMALCSVLHIGTLMTPMHMGIEGETAREFAGMGMVYLLGVSS